MQPMQNSTLSNLTVLKICGEDAATFLQGQLTNDVNQLNGNWHYSGYCNPKGRLLALFILWRSNNGYYAVVDSSLAEMIIKRLKMFVLRSKVVIETLDQAHIIAVKDELAKRNQLLVEGDSTHLQFDGYSIVVSPSGETISKNDTPQQIGIDEWKSQNIKHGLPWISDQTHELFVPQMINLDLLGGINFKKGCYTGQEIVARMHYLGKLKQRMYLCEIETQSSAQAGDKVITQEGKSVGNLVVDPQQGRCLAVLRTELSDSTLTLDNEQSTTLKVSASQPYEFG